MRSPPRTVALLVGAAVAGCGSPGAAGPPRYGRQSKPLTLSPVAVDYRRPASTSRLAPTARLTRWRLPAPVYRTVAAALGERIFVFGGHDAAGGTSSDVYELDTATGRTRTAGTLVLPTHGAAAANLAGRLLVFGGASSIVHDVVQRFYPARRAASVIGRLPRARADVTAVTVGHTVVLVGGYDGIGPQGAVWASGNGRTFRTVAKLVQPVRYPAAVADGDSVYVFGGLISGGEYTGRFSDLIQRVRLGERTAHVVGHLPRPLAHAVAALIGGQLLVFGGSTPSGPSAQILRFDPKSHRVGRAGRLPFAWTDGAVATIGESAYLLGGISTRPLAGVIVVRLGP
jgi:hypothetical protein